MKVNMLAEVNRSPDDATSPVSSLVSSLVSRRYPKVEGFWVACTPGPSQHTQLLLVAYTIASLEEVSRLLVALLRLRPLILLIVMIRLLILCDINSVKCYQEADIIRVIEIIHGVNEVEEGKVAEMKRFFC